MVAFDHHALIQGKQFTCTGCGAVIGLAPESVATVSSALAKLESLRNQASDSRRGSR